MVVSNIVPCCSKFNLGTPRYDEGSTKDESRSMAAAMFPEVAAAGRLKRKKDHGRAESLLIAAYGHMAGWVQVELVLTHGFERRTVSNI